MVGALSSTYTTTLCQDKFALHTLESQMTFLTAGENVSVRNRSFFSPFCTERPIYNHRKHPGDMQTVIKTLGSLVRVRAETLVRFKQTFFCHQHRPNSIFCKRHQKMSLLLSSPFFVPCKSSEAEPANRFTRAHINIHICFCYLLTTPHTVTVKS